MINFNETYAENIPQGTQIRIGTKENATPTWYTVLGKTLLNEVIIRKETDNSIMEIYPKTIVLIEQK